MQVVSNARRVSRLLQSPIFLSSHPRNTEAPIFSGLTQRNYWQVKTEPLHFFSISKAFYTSGVDTVQETPTEAVKELYDKMLESVNVKRSMPPNAWLWSMISNCKQHHDVKLLFDILQNLRRFRLSNLRIHDNFNCNLCREVTKACVHAGALDFGKKALWKHNVYGLTPSVASAHHLLMYAKNHNDTKLLVEVMKLLKRNDLPLQPGTADIVFSICYNTDDWELINKYAKRFVKADVKLRQTSFDTWMKFAAKRGDTESLWKIEKLRSESMKQHTLATGLSCAKGLLLERKPSEAAAIIQVLNQTLSDAKKSGIKDELQKLVSEWPLEVIKHKKEEERKTLAASLKSDILAMVSDLLNMGLETNISLEDLNRKDGIPQ
ncbi:Tetratricopeptide-like helical domain superfamily [Sesbania bispinosa]|nr:Tetratricopeptide-like helical domain superfamily [Sesbania bispinosa]